MSLRWHYDNLSRPREEELLQLAIAILNSSLEKGFHGEGDIELISSRILVSTLQCKACHKSSMFKQGWLLYLIASIAGSFCLLTQFISSQDPCLLLVISCILLSKKVRLVSLTVFWKDFQSSRFLNNLYSVRLLLQSSFHQLFECFMILMDLKFLSHAHSTKLAKELTAVSSQLVSDRLEVLSSLINATSSLLFLTMYRLEEFTYSSTIGILMVYITSH